MRFLIAFLVLAVQPVVASAYDVILQKSQGVPVTVFNVTFRVGSADDPKGQEGIANLTARLLREGGVAAWKGLPARSRAELEEFLFPFAAEIEVSVEKEQISFEVSCASSDAGLIFNVLSQLVLAPAFDSNELERLRAEELDALTKQWPREDEEELGKAALDREIYGVDHPYSHVVDGRAAALKSLTLEQIREFYKSRFTQARLTLGLAGVVGADLEAKARTIFKSLENGSGAARADVPAAPKRESLKLLIVKGPFDATGVHLGQPLPFNRASRDHDGMYLAALAFGKHRSFVGRLMKVVREIRSLNYGSYAYVEDFPHGGHEMIEPTQAARTRQAFTVWGRPSTLENGCFLLRQLHREVESLAAEGLSEDEFKLAKSHLIGNAPLLATGLERRLGYAIDAKFYGIGGDYLKRLQSSAQAAQRAAINALLKKYLHPETLSAVVVTADPAKFKDQILGARCDIHYAEGSQKSPDVLKEDQAIAAHSLGLKAEDVSIIESDALFQ